MSRRDTKLDDIRCKGCGLHPYQLDEYVDLAYEEGLGSAEAAVIEQEGTFNRETGLFWCTSCYIKAGMPDGIA